MEAQQKFKIKVKCKCCKGTGLRTKIRMAIPCMECRHDIVFEHKGDAETRTARCLVDGCHCFITFPKKNP